MLKIKDTLVSLDIIERFFACDLSCCGGQCCIEGDAGAPLEKKELLDLLRILPAISDDLTPEARAVIKEKGVAYIDEEGDTVTSIINGRDCVFAYRDSEGICKCAIENAYLAGRTGIQKPISCRLYPVRVKEYGAYKAVNYDRWSICKPAEILGAHRGIPVYIYLREALTEKFGEEWYNELDLCAREWRRSH
jgi:hypothetical protein